MAASLRVEIRTDGTKVVTMWSGSLTECVDAFHRLTDKGFTIDYLAKSLVNVDVKTDEVETVEEMLERKAREQITNTQVRRES